MVKEKPYLIGEKTYLRLLDETAADLVTTFRNNPDVWNNLAQTFPVSFESELDWVKKKSKPNSNSFVFAVVLKETNDLIGSMGLHDIDWMSRTAVTGTLIGRTDLHSQGYATDAKKILLNWAFNVLNLRIVYSRVFSFNKASLRYAEKCGYKEIARFPESIFRNGKYHDLVTLQITQADWFSKK